MENWQLAERLLALEARVYALEHPSKELATNKTKAKRGTRLPDGWAPSEDTVYAIVKELNVSSRQLETEHRRFCDYWYGVAGQRGVKLDWEATWRNWMRKAYEQGSLGGVNSTSTEKKMNGYIDRSERLAALAREAQMPAPGPRAVEIEDGH